MKKDKASAVVRIYPRTHKKAKIEAARKGMSFAALVEAKFTPQGPIMGGTC